MTRTKQVVVVTLLACFFIFWKAPASLVDSALTQATNQKIGLTDASGTLWNGSGTLILTGNNREIAATIPSIEWKVVNLNLNDVQIQVRHNGKSIALLKANIEGWQGNIHGLHIEAQDITPLLPTFLSKGEWKGSVVFNEFTAQGSWKSINSSKFQIEWLHAATTLIPKGELGSYTITGQGNHSDTELAIESQNGPLLITGNGSLSRQNGMQFKGNLIDRAGIINHFPDFLGAYILPGNEPGRYNLNVSQPVI